MPKNKNEKPKREMTRRQLTHHQRESRIQRFTLIGGVLIIAIVLALVGTAVYGSKIKPFNATVLKVGDEEYSMNYYIDTLEYYGKIYYQMYQQFGMSTTFSDILNNIAGSIPGYIEQRQFLKEAAAQLDTPVTVSDDEVNKYIQDNKLPTNQSTKDAVYAQLLDPKLKDYFDKKLPATDEQRAVLAMFLESQNEVDKVKSEIAAGKDFHDIASQSSLVSESKSKNGDFGWVPKGVLSTTLGNNNDTILEGKVFSLSSDEINKLIQAEDKDQSKDVGYWLIKVTETREKPASTATPTPTPSGSPTPTTTTPEASPITSPTPTPIANNTQLHVFAMLLPSEEAAGQIKAQLSNGADFITLAKTNSQYTDSATNGGDLGFKSKGDMPSAVDKILFPENGNTPALNTVFNPIQDTTQTTTGGIWLIQVTGIDPAKTLEGDNRSTLANNDKQDFENKVWSDSQSKIPNLSADPNWAKNTSFAIEQAIARNK